MAELELNEEQFAAIIQAAILKSIDQKSRDKLVENALAKLIERSKDRYGYRQPSEVERIFERAVADLAVKVVAEKMATDGVKQAVDKFVDDAIRFVLEECREKAIESMAYAWRNAFSYYVDKMKEIEKQREQEERAKRERGET